MALYNCATLRDAMPDMLIYEIIIFFFKTTIAMKKRFGETSAFSVTARTPRNCKLSHQFRSNRSRLLKSLMLNSRLHCIPSLAAAIPGSVGGLVAGWNGRGRSVPSGTGRYCREGWLTPCWRAVRRCRFSAVHGGPSALTSHLSPNRHLLGITA